MPSSPVSWSCVTCDVKLRKRCRTHGPCGSMTTWTCITTGRKGQYHSYKQHARHCEFCSPDREVDIHEEKEAQKENRFQAVEEEEKGHLFTLLSPTHPVFSFHYTSSLVPPLSCGDCCQSPLHGHGMNGVRAMLLWRERPASTSK
jgi:hypothetical protein